ncbi:hypothetical protein HPB52_002315 [Rhipicephalus sanguineus]|uniref:Uncharacterized protein n=1 Tax=Rhipicephalus sanguineus TaxID=34632 RepID=A0A9D4PEH7_RHISA|nr:hypothetical protein HPB52_002315 [Rhipicephalus sanguineus]
MSKRKRNQDASTTTKEVKHEALGLVDMSGIQSRHTGLNVDYKKACTWRDDHQCHIWNNNVSWNGFFVNVGLELQERNFGDMSLFPVSEYARKACRATQEEKTQAATLLYWLLTKHRCVKEVSISEEVFEGHEDIVCGALSGSVSVTEVTLWLSSSLLNNRLVSSLSSMEHLTRLSVITDAQEAFFRKLAHLLRTSPSSTYVLDAVHAIEQRSRRFGALFEDLCRKDSLRSVSIVARIFPELRHSRPHLGCASFAWKSGQLLTTLQVASPERGPEVDVQAVCEAVSVSPVLTQLDIELLKLKNEYAAPIQKMLRSTKTLKSFGLNYNDVEKHYRAPFHQRYVDSLTPLYSCVRCRTIHILETCRIMPWIEALLQVNSSMNELRFSVFAFCTLECRAFLKALSNNTTLKMLTIPRLGQIPSEYCKFVADAGVMHRVTADIRCNLPYPGALRAPQHILGQFANLMPCVALERMIWEAAAFGLVAHVHLNVYSVLCLTGETDPTASPLVQLIRKSPALVTVDIRLENSCCSRCWNLFAPPLCDAVLHNTGIQTLAVKLPKNPAMDLLPLAELLHRHPGLFKFALEPPCPKVFGEFLREVLKPRLWDDYNLAFVDLRCDAPDLLGMMLRMKQVADRNSTLAMRAAKFVGGMHNSDNARALETMAGSLLFVKKVRDFLRLDKQQALDRIAVCLRDVTDMKKFLRLTGVIHKELVCHESHDGSTQLTDINEYCLRHIRRYLKFSDIQDSPV